MPENRTITSWGKKINIFSVVLDWKFPAKLFLSLLSCLWNNEREISSLTVSQVGILWDKYEEPKDNLIVPKKKKKKEAYFSIHFLEISLLPSALQSNA